MLKLQNNERKLKMKKLFSVLIFISITLSLSACAIVPAKNNVPAPKITKGEFPFELVYEKDGEVITANDVYVCEYEGIKWNENFGNYRQWKGYAKSTGESYFLFYEEGNTQIVCDIGSPAYYMNDPTAANMSDFVPAIYYRVRYESGGISSGKLDEETLLEKYDLKLISWKFSEPIENSFE